MKQQKKLDALQTESSKDKRKDKELIVLEKTKPTKYDRSFEEEEINLTNFDNLESQFKDNLQINKVKYDASTQNQKKGRDEENYTRKKWYPKPTTLDLQFEERHTFINFAHFADLVYE